MSRPPDWPEHALAWFKSLTGDQRRAVVNALGPETPAGGMFARLTMAALEETDEEKRAKTRAIEIPKAIESFRDWLKR